MSALSANARDDSKPRVGRHRVSRVRMLSGGCCTVEVEGPIPPTLPGQFYMLRTVEAWPVFLPRPFSLYERHPDGLDGSFLLKTVGPGTRALAAASPGDELWLTGPLGRPFPLDETDPICVAGGIGLAPFWLLAQRQVGLGRPLPRLVFGGRDAGALAGIQDFAATARVHPCTDDGSHGFHGLVTALMRDMLDRDLIRRGETVFCCGPDKMMEAVGRLCEASGLRCFVSLETYMACGYGVCNGCSVAVQGPRFQGWPYSKTCLQGPVYETTELTW